MRSSRTGRDRLSDQRGIGLVEVLVASAILGVSLAVMLANMSTMVVGARVADRRTTEERLVRNQIEILMAADATCTPPVAPKPPPVDGTQYTVKVKVPIPCPNPSDHSLEYVVTARDPSGGSVSLTVARYLP